MHVQIRDNTASHVPNEDSKLTVANVKASSHQLIADHLSCIAANLEFPPELLLDQKCVSTEMFNYSTGEYLIANSSGNNDYTKNSLPVDDAIDLSKLSLYNVTLILT